MEGEPNKMLSQSAVCARLLISDKTLHRLITRGHFPQGLRISREVMWPEQDVEAFLYLLSRGLFGAPTRSRGKADQEDT